MSELDVQEVEDVDRAVSASQTLRKTMSDKKRKRKRKVKLGLYQTKNKQTLMKKNLRRPTKKMKMDESLATTIGYSDIFDQILLDDTQSTVAYSEKLSGQPGMDVSSNAVGEKPSDTYDDIPDFEDNNTSEVNYADSCVNQMLDSGMLRRFVNLLDDNSCLYDFMTFMSLVVSGKMSVKTIPFLLCLDLAKFLSLKTTTQMVYREQTKKFWQAVYRFGGGTVIRLFSGMKNFGQVCMKQCKKSLYDPMKSRVNFAVPDLKILSSGIGLCRSKIPCGFIQETIDLLRRDKEYNICVDGKKISPGCGPDNEGDINIFGLEGPPSLEQQNKRLEYEIGVLNDIISDEEANDDKYGKNVDNLPDVLAISSCRIKDLRTTNVNHELLKITLEKSLGKDAITVKKFTKAIASIETYQVFSSDLVERILNENQRMCGLMSQIKNNYDNFVDGKEVDLNKQSNASTLLPPDRIKINDDEELLPEYTKQGTDEWLILRKEAVVTSSTTYAALGLDTIKKQKQHFNEFVLGHPPEPISEELQRKFDHGKENEKHAFGTLCGTVLPALFPNCKSLIEVGTMYLRGDNREKLVSVSPDGVITTRQENSGCRSGKHGADIDLSVEFKSPMGENKLVTPVHYQIPKYYVPQVLLQLRVLEVDMGLYCSYSKQSMVVLLIEFDTNLWKKLWDLTKKTYDHVSLKKLNRCAASCSEIKELIDDFVRNNCSILLEVPSCTAVYHNYKGIISDNPFHSGKSNPKILPHVQTTKVQLVESCKRMKTLIHEVYEMERRKATELVMIIANDTDRIFDPDSYYALPVAYFLKGYSLTVDKMRTVLEIVMNKLKSEGITVVSQSFDGQWHNLAVRDRNDQPLTKLQLMKKVWSKLGRITKENMLRIIDELIRVRREDLSKCSTMQFLTNGSVKMGNLTVTQEFIASRRKLTASCTGGSSQVQNVYSKINLPTPHERPDIWRHDFEHETTSHSSPKKFVKLKANSNILTLLPQEFLQSDSIQSAISTLSEIAVGEQVNENAVGEETVEDQLPDLNDPSDPIEEGLLRKHRQFLEGILVGLCSQKRSHLWSTYTVEDLYYNVLLSQKQMLKLTSYEMDVIDNVFFSYKGKHLYKSTDMKPYKLKVLCQLFGRHRSLNVERPKNTKRITLRKLATDVIRDVDFPCHALAVAIANMYHIELKEKWMNAATVPMRIRLPVSNTIHECFSYPEYVESRDQIEPKLLDPTHMLTNVRTHICTKGYNNIKTSAFIRVSETDNSVLNRAYIVNMVDKQSATIAMKFFSVDVQRILLENGDVEESDFVGLIRLWYEAVDERGFPVPVRLQRMQDLYEYLTSLVNFDLYPPPKKYVQGIPILTFEQLLQNISTRIQLYGLCKDNTYNHRSISTLAIETFFSILSRMEGSFNGCPKSVQLAKMLKKLIEMYELQTDPSKLFNIHVSNKKKYPEHELMSPDEDTSDEADTSNMSQGTSTNDVYSLVYKAHKFDRRIIRTRKKKTKNVDITTGNKPIRREGGVRVYFKAYDSQIKSTTRHGLPN